MTRLVDRLFFVPTRQLDPAGRPEAYGLRHKEVELSAPGGPKLRGWLVESKAGTSRGLVVHVHGNAANISVHGPAVYFIARGGYDLLLFDYRGFGESGGTITREGVVADARAALDLGASIARKRHLRMSVFGQSMGAAVGIVASAGRKDLASAVFEAPFTSFRAISRDVLRRAPGIGQALAPLTGLVVAKGNDPIDHVGKLACPVMIVHGQEDTLVPHWMGVKLHEAAPNPKELFSVKGYGHLAPGSRQIQRAYEARVLGFLGRWMKAAAR